MKKSSRKFSETTVTLFNYQEDLYKRPKLIDDDDDDDDNDDDDDDFDSRQEDVHSKISFSVDKVLSCISTYSPSYKHVVHCPW